MDLLANIHVNYLAVLIAAIVYFILGAVWYSDKVFGTDWMAHHGIPLLERKPNPIVYVGEFILDLITAFVLAVIISATKAVNWKEGLVVAFLVWLGFVFTLQFSGFLWSKKSLKAFLITTGFSLMGLLLMGLIIASMQKGSVA